MDPAISLAFVAGTVILAFWAGWSARGIRDRTDNIDRQIAEKLAHDAQMAPLHKAMRRAEIISPAIFNAKTGEPLRLNADGKTIDVSEISISFTPPAKHPHCILCAESIPHEFHAGTGREQETRI